jgi:FkbM family methyltransferase
MHPGKWAQAVRHFFPNLIGFPKYFFAHPQFALKLFMARTRYFFTRRLEHPITTSDQFLIEDTEELVSYWSFFIERECRSREWVNALLSTKEPAIVDVGANAGLFTHWVWTLRPETKFIVFEPLPKMAEKIASWGKTTGAALTLYSKAVSDYSGMATFYASADNDVTASLKPDGDKHTQLDVPVVTLDSIIPPMAVVMLKIDVEGAECEVLAGAKSTLERTEFLLVEAHTEAALRRIQSQLTPKWQSKKVGASDYLFSRVSPGSA